MIRLPHCFLLIACSLAGCVTAKPIAPESRTSPVNSAMCARMKARHVLTQGAPVDCDQLRIVRFPYIDFDGRTHDDGAIMVMAAATTHVEAIFNTLYQRRFPIAQAQLMDHYLGDDAASMQHNNTSAFNHRPITGGNALSLHSYGLAIDLNPIQNPYIQFNNQGQASYSPAAGSNYANRLNPRPAKPVRPGMAEEVVQVFADNGFLIWGGDWDTPIDYQHFQVSRTMAEQMASLPVEAARTLFSSYVARYRTCRNENINKKEDAARAFCAGIAQ